MSDVIVIGVAGGTGSGKTTLVKALRTASATISASSATTIITSGTTR